MNIMKKTIHTAVLLAGVVGFASGVSAETHYKPANFGFTGEGLLASMPEETRNMKDSAVVYCQSEISEKGAVVRSQCYDKQGRDALVSNTEKALEGLAFTPAEVDGKKVPVLTTIAWRQPPASADKRPHEQNGGANRRRPKEAR